MGYLNSSSVLISSCKYRITLRKTIVYNTVMANFIVTEYTIIRAFTIFRRQITPTWLIKSGYVSRHLINKA